MSEGMGPKFGRLFADGYMRRIRELMENAPPPDRAEWGDPKASEAEDMVILDQFSTLRKEANKDI